MQIINSDEVEQQKFSHHRPGHILNKRLFHGKKDRSSFEFSIVHSQDNYSTPRHRHNFDQIRFMLQGRFGYGDGVQEEGSIGYFTEGVYYQQQGIGESDTLLLQFGGASGDGFIQYEELERGYEELSAKGSFHDGIYTWYERDKKHNQDAYEAIWEYLCKKKVSYQKPRYDKPVIMKPEHFNWVPTDKVGVQRKLVGIFSERNIEIAFLRIDTGASVDIQGARLLYTMKGDGTFNFASNKHALTENIAIHLEQGESGTCHANSLLELYEIGLPVFDQD